MKLPDVRRSSIERLRMNAGRSGCYDTPIPTPFCLQFSVFGSGDFNNYAGLGLTLAVSFTNFMGTFGCNISARYAGDSYSPMEMVSVPCAGSVC